MIILVAFVFASLLNTTGDMANDGLPTPTAPLVQSASPVSPSLSEKPSEKPDVIDKKDSAKWTDIISAYGTLAGAIVGGIAAIAAALSAYCSFRTVRQADATEKERSRSAKAERFSALWSEISEWKFLNKEELNDLNSTLVAETVRRNINSMGKVGFWWETNLIDHEIVAKEIAQTYVPLFEQISRIGKLASLKRSGSDLIQENPSARKLYDDLKNYLTKNAVPARTDNKT